MWISKLCLFPVALILATPVPAQELEYMRSPGPLGPRAPRVGEWIPELALELADGGQSSLSTVAGERGLVLFMRDTDCPLSKRYSPKVARLEGELKEQGFGVLHVGVDSDEVARDVAAHGFEAPYAVDPEQALARALAATTTTEVFVLDRARTLVYRGMIDDQYGLGFAKPAASREYLREAVSAVAAGEQVARPQPRPRVVCLRSTRTSTPHAAKSLTTTASAASSRTTARSATDRVRRGPSR